MDRDLKLLLFVVGVCSAAASAIGFFCMMAGINVYAGSALGAVVLFLGWRWVSEGADIAWSWTTEDGDGSRTEKITETLSEEEAEAVAELLEKVRGQPIGEETTFSDRESKMVHALLDRMRSKNGE